MSLTTKLILLAILLTVATNSQAGQVGNLVWQDGTRYYGGLNHGKQHGYGVITWPDGTKYEGEFNQGNRQGKGVLTLPDGRQFSQTFAPDNSAGRLTLDPASSPGPKSLIQQTLTRWAQAWSKQNTQEYFRQYSDKFRPRLGLALLSWRAQRTQRLRQPKFIKIELSQIDIQLLGNTAKVTFKQLYQSDQFTDTVAKLLELKNEHGNWHITSELTL